MRLDEYIWSRNPRGLHVQRVLITPLDYSRWTDPHFGWVKLVAAEHEYVDDSMDFLARGITPIVRLYVERPGAMPFDARLRDLTLQYVNAGVRWFEFYNEPNLPIEWPPGQWIHWQNFDGMIRPLMDNWLVWAEYIASLGCYPGFPALAESAAPDSSAVFWMDAFLNYLAQARRDRFGALLNSGLYCATHPYILNHFYQEVPGLGPTSARPPEAQNAREAGWHFEYPYDPISQRTDPGRTVYGGTARTPNGDPVGLTAMGRMFNERCAQVWGAQAVPVVGTEGGIFPFDDEPQYQQDSRYPYYTRDSQAEATVAMFEWISRQGPPWFFGVCLWKEDEYYKGGPLRAIERLRETPPLYNAVPPLEVMQAPIGPGPVHGEPTFHAVILAPGLEPRWFFETARAYWNRFRPLVTTSWDFIQHIPHDRSLAATVVAPPDMSQAIVTTIQQQYPNVLIDLVVAQGDLGQIAEVFNGRVWSDRRFG
ncbi:MAG: hypothetical protein HXY41_13595 [Chloroflexi bacterium]|nr:hypothetical protein [Chloroflexota bacterium]